MLSTEHPREQVTFYDTGVGSARPSADEAARRRFSDALCWGTEPEMLSPGLPGEIAVHAVPIRYLGLWDTVDATGLLRPDRLRWPDADTLANVQTIRHAVSIDERRRPYRECLVAAGHPDAQEVWFSGVHCDVGGTPPEHELSTVALKWVVDGAVEGLRLRTRAYGWRCPRCPVGVRRHSGAPTMHLDRLRAGCPPARALTGRA